MKRWKNFLKLRRQNDAVKLVLVFFLAGLMCMGSVCYHGIELYRMMAARAEYVLTIPGEAETSDIRHSLHKLQELSESGELKELRSSDILTLSLQQHKSVTVRYQGQELCASYIELSEEYLDKVYGIRQKGSIKTFYLNQKAWDMFDSAKKELLLSFVTDKAQEEGIGLLQTARFVLVTDQLQKEYPIILSREENGSLAAAADSIRICFKTQGTETGRIETLKDWGFDFEDGEALLRSAHKRELLWERMKYKALIGAFCFLDMGILWRYSKCRNR